MATPPRPKRRHHVNPRFYLRAFQVQGEDGFIWRYDSASGEPLKLSIENTAVQTDYYSHINEEGLRDTEFVENFIADIEGYAAPVFMKAISNEELDDDERVIFAYFVALSWARAPATRRQTAELLAMMVESTGHAIAMDAQYFRASVRAMEDDKGTAEEDRIPDAEIERMREFIQGHEYRVDIAQEATLLSMDKLQGVAALIHEMTWTWMTAPERFEFITSDSPVARDLPSGYRNPWMGPGFLNPEIQVSLPLSPRLCWLGTWKEEMAGSIVLPKEFAKALNRLRAIHAEQYLYASSYDSGLSKLAKKYHGYGWKLTASGGGFGGKLIKTKQFKMQSKGIAQPKKGSPKQS